MSEHSPLVQRDSSGKMDMRYMFEKIIQPCMAELFGTAFFVFIGTCSMATGDLLTIGAAHGLALGIAIVSIGSISGGHLNPAVTLGVAIGGGVAPVMGIFYILAQLIGAILGAACCRGVLDYTLKNANETVYESIDGGATLVADHVGLGTAVLAEIICTSLLVIVVLMTAVNTKSKSAAAGLYIGLALFVSILAIGSVTGASLNPARSFGPALVYTPTDSVGWDDHWVYWVGPLSGGIIIALLYRLLFADDEKRLFLKHD